jgi:hypothetical protein
MSTMTPTATADIFGIAQDIANRFRRFSQTTLIVGNVSNEVGRVIRGWDESVYADLQTIPLHEPVKRDAGPSLLTMPNEPADAVDHIAELLGVPHERAVEAAQVATRTYYGWRSGRRARPQSLGRLWPMTEAIHYMARANDNLTAWFHSTPAAQRAFDAGDVDTLIQLELDWAMRSYPRHDPVAPDFGDGPSLPDGDTAPVEPEPAPRGRRLLKSGNVAKVTLTPRTARES